MSEPDSLRDAAHGRLSLVHRPVAVLMLLLCLGVVGVLAYRGIPLQLAPPGLVSQHISVDVRVPESTPEEVLEEVTKPLEESFRTIPGITEIVSESWEDECEIEVEYERVLDGDAIYGDLRDRIERLLPSFPEGVDRYRIFRFNVETDLPILWVAVTRRADGQDIDALIENVIQPRFEAVPGVARVDVRGLIDRRVDIRLDPEQVRAYGLDLRSLIERLRGDNIVVPGGYLREDESRTLLRFSSRFRDLDEIRGYRIDDSLTLGDIATVGYRRAVRQFLVRRDGELSNMLQIYKQSEANTVETCRRIEEVMANDLAREPRLEALRFWSVFSQGKVIEDSIESLKSGCVWGGLFAIVILYLFLRRVGVTLVVAAAIPLSLLITVVVIFFQGGTFNMLSIIGLTLAVGTLVDNAIVVAENIFRLRQLDVPVRRAAVEGAREVALAITLATLTTVAVFLPMFFVSGNSMIRIMMKELGSPVCVSLLASLAVAMVFIPLGTVYVAGRTSAAPARARDETHSRLSGSLACGRLARIHRALLGACLRHRFAAFLVSVLVFGSWWIPNTLLRSSGGEERRVHEVRLEMEFPPGFTLNDADEEVQLLQKAVKPHYESFDIRNCVSWYWRRGGMLAFLLEPEAVTTRIAFLEKLKPHLPKRPGVKLQFAMESSGESEANRLDLEARGRDPVVLAGILADVGERLRELPGVLDVSTARDESDGEVHVEIDREHAQRYDVSPSGLALVVAWALRGAPLADFQTDDEELPLWIELEGSEMENIADLHGVEVFSQAGNPVALANLARFRVARGLPAIRRVDGAVEQRLQIVTDDTIDHGKLRRWIQALASQIDLPEGYQLAVDSGREDEEFQNLSSALLLGFVLIVVLMGVLFESVLLPLSVLLSVPYMFTGASWFMYWLDEPLTESSYIGFILLLGIVVNNAIVLVDCINRFRAVEPDRTRAILEAGTVRLRPILMTAATTICGLMPLVVFRETGEGFDYRPLAVVVLGGLTVSTLLTLVVVPLYYTFFDDLKDALALHGALRSARLRK